MNSLRFGCRALATFACLVASDLPASEKRDTALIEDLLKLPAPPPDWREQLSRAAPPGEAPTPPDAPLETLVEFWQLAPAGPAPERRVQTRLLESCEAHPEQLVPLLRWFPTDAPDFHDRVKAIFDKLEAGLAAEPRWSDILSPAFDWLMFNSRHFRGELIENTRETFSDNDGNTLARHVLTLARLDRAATEKLLLSLAEDKDRFTHTAALVWLHSIYSASDDARLVGWRTDLQRIAADVSAPARARDYAIVGLMRSRWPGQEDWYLGLFRDASLGGLPDGATVFSPLCAVANDDPDRWIPKIGR